MFVLVALWGIAPRGLDAEGHVASWTPEADSGIQAANIRQP